MTNAYVIPILKYMILKFLKFIKKNWQYPIIRKLFRKNKLGQKKKQ